MNRETFDKWFAWAIYHANKHAPELLRKALRAASPHTRKFFSGEDAEAAATILEALAATTPAELHKEAAEAAGISE